MKTTLEFEYELDERVTVMGIERPGIVKSYFVGSKGIQYLVRYLYEGDFKEVYFYRDELSRLPKEDSKVS